MKKYIPNTLTCCNLISGCIATFYGFCGDPQMALLWIIVGAAFDFFDGMSARLLGVSSPIGKELDSLADDITFGFAPSAIVFAELSIMPYPTALAPIADYIPFVAFIMAAFSAIRLAKFNLDERQTTSFIGVPTPANALFWGSLVCSCQTTFETQKWASLIVIIGILMCSWLLVCELPMFALKFKHWGWKNNEVRYSFILLSVIFLATLGFVGGFWVIIACYFLISCFLAIKNGKETPLKEVQDK